MRAAELVLFKITSHELFAIGVTQTDHAEGFDWSVAWSNDSREVRMVIQDTLDRVGIGAWGSCDLGGCGWYVRREKFFQARKALLDSPAVQSLDVQVVTPEFGLR
jgi:hypothetical protein